MYLITNWLIEITQISSSRRASMFQYLDYANYGDTLEAFKGECVTKGRPIPQSSGIKSDQKKHDIQVINPWKGWGRNDFVVFLMYLLILV